MRKLLTILRRLRRRRADESPLERARRASRSAAREAARLRGKPRDVGAGTLDSSSVSLDGWDGGA